VPVATALPTTSAHLSGLLEAVLPEPSLRALVGQAGAPKLELQGPPAARPLVVAALARAGHPVLAITATDREAGELTAELADVLGAAVVAELVRRGVAVGEQQIVGLCPATAASEVAAGRLLEGRLAAAAAQEGASRCRANAGRAQGVELEVRVLLGGGHPRVAQQMRHEPDCNDMPTSAVMRRECRTRLLSICRRRDSSSRRRWAPPRTALRAALAAQAC